MADTIYSRLDGDALRALLDRTALGDAPLITVGATLRIEDYNAAAAELTGLHALERIDQMLSEQAAAALRACIETKTPRTVYEEIDETSYRMEILPYGEGALLAFLQNEGTVYDGTLRVLQVKGAQYLGSLLADVQQIDDPALAARMRQHCMRLHRMLTHADFLHDPPLTEQLRLQHEDLAALCRDAAAEVERCSACKVAVTAPDLCLALIEPQMVRTALYNLLVNAVRVTPAGGQIDLQLRDDGTFFVLTVSDRGPGLNPQQFELLLSGWHRAFTMDSFLTAAREGAPLGLGLPLAERVARLHGGSLLLSPREGGGSELHLSLAHLPESLAAHNLYAPLILEDAYALEEVELSVLDNWTPPQA